MMNVTRLDEDIDEDSFNQVGAGISRDEARTVVVDQ